MAKAAALALIVLLGAAVALFVMRPGLDLAVAHIFYVRGSGFIGPSPLADVGRTIGRGLPLVVLSVLGLCYLGRRCGVVPPSWAPSGRNLLVLAVSMALGPGLLVNGLKDVSHRPRPVHVRAFGGALPSRPFYRFDGGCVRNCSFPSGEASAAFWMVAPASLVPPPLRAIAIVAAVLFGVATSVLRLAYGAHFLSDVVFAGLIVGFVIVAVRRVLAPRGSHDALAVGAERDRDIAPGTSAIIVAPAGRPAERE